MARVLRWTEDAANDIVSIAEFIGRDSEYYAKAVIKKIVDKIRLIPKDQKSVAWFQK